VLRSYSGGFQRSGTALTERRAAGRFDVRDTLKGPHMTIQSSNDFRTVLKSSASFGRIAGMGALLALFASPVLANPSSAAVTTGSASVATSANKTTIDQKSEDVVINWSSFNVGAGQTTQFVQPNAQAIAVNRIGGNSASQILGTLDANGRIVLINGNGMLFGKGSRVDVGSLVATSTGGSDSDVLSGKFTQGGNQNASVVNQGRITARQGGLVALVAPSVTNAGMVNAKFGMVAVGAANKFTVDFTGDGLVSFAAQGDVNGRASATNTGSLSGANVSLTAHAAEGVATGVVTMSGIVTAQTAKNVGGTILLDAGDGSLTSTGTLNAAGHTGGGNIETSGANVSVSGTVTAGEGGKWKTDPDNLTITAPAAKTISGALNAGTGVWEETSSGAASGNGNSSPGNGDIVIDAPIIWNTGAMIYLYAYHSIVFNAPMIVQNGGCLSFGINNANGSGALNTGGVLSFAGKGQIEIDTSGTSFTLNNVGYAVLDNVSTLASDIASNPSGNYVLGLPYNATADGTYTSSPIAATFTGTFYGLGNTISHLSIDETSGSAAGLFADIGSGGLVSGLGVTAANVIGASGADTGALAGIVSGSVYDDYSRGHVVGSGDVGGLVGLVNSGGSVNDSYSAAETIGLGASEAGGLIGTDDSTTASDYDYATGKIMAGGKSEAGGLIGAATGASAEYDFATGAVSGLGGSIVGGLVGLASNTSLSQAYSTGAVTAGKSSLLGGLIGKKSGGTNSALYWDLTTSGVGSTHGVGNIVSAPGVTGLTTVQFQSGLPSGFDASVWGSSPSIDGGMPYLLANPPPA
jgi:filamentous hemagglutinin family protein